MAKVRVGLALRVLLFLAVLTPSLTYVWVAAHWERRHPFQAEGDEPHYLILADAIVTDQTLDVRESYAREALEKRIIGPVDWQQHAREGPEGLYSLHGPGLSALVAAPFGRFGVLGARVALTLVVGLIPFAFFGIARLLSLDSRDSAILAASAGFGLPFLAAAGQVFPDLIAGVPMLALVVAMLVLSRPGPQAVSILAAAGLMAAFLPWLHIKNFLPAGILSCGVIVLEWRHSRLTLTRSACTLAPLVGSLGLLTLYDSMAFGSALGSYSAAEAAGATVRQAGMIFLGLHLDQAQGIFILHPLFILACLGLAIGFWRLPIVFGCLVLAYLAVVIPNAFHTCWYGCHSIGGRFMWTVAALWFIPLVLLFSALGAYGKHLVRVFCVLSVWWQILLMTDWVPGGPAPLRMAWTTDLFARNSFFVGDMRKWLPSFYDFQGYLSAQNLWWIASTVALLGVGIILARRWRRQGTNEGAQASSKGFRAFQIVSALAAVSMATGVTIARTPAASIDLIELLPKAQRRPSGAGDDVIRVADKMIAGDARRAIVARAPSRVIWPVRVPDDGVLRVAIAVDDEALQREGDGVLFRIGVSDETRYRDLFTRHLNPRRGVGDQGWISVSVDLSTFRRRTVSLIFNAESSAPLGRDPRPDVACWGNPTVERRITAR